MNINYKSSIASLLLLCIVLIYNTVKSQNKMKTEVPQLSAFPTGEENTAYAKYFTGKSWLAPLTSNEDLNVPMANVTFEPECRNNWHSHTGGQLLIVVAGEGLYQEKANPHVI